METGVARRLPEFRLESYFTRWEFTARYHLTASDAQTISLSELLELATPEDRHAWETQTLGYVPTFGTPEFRDAVARTYDAIGAQDTIAFAGAGEGIFCAMNALLQPGDHAVVVTPTYQSLEELPRALAETSGVALRERENWALDLDEVASALRPNTKLIAINFPNNPTGKVIDRSTFDDLIALARQRGIWIFSDEVYRGVERDQRDTLAQMADSYERGVSLGVMSKAYGLPGLRTGWIACRDRELITSMEKIKHYLSICNAGPSELLARIALRARTTLLERNRSLCAANLEKLERFFARYAGLFEWYAPEGACVAFPRYCGADGVDAFCAALVENAGVLLLPGSVYESALTPVPVDRFRIGFGRAHIDEALAAFASFLDRRA